ncbi:hypothetical protein AB4K20DRAFT_1947934 [Rhizopus microsporus]
MPFILRINYDDGTTKDIIHLTMPRPLLPYYWRIKKFFGLYYPPEFDEPKSQEANISSRINGKTVNQGNINTTQSSVLLALSQIEKMKFSLLAAAAVLIAGASAHMEQLESGLIDYYWLKGSDGSTGQWPSFNSAR